VALPDMDGMGGDWILLEDCTIPAMAVAAKYASMHHVPSTWLDSQACSDMIARGPALLCRKGIHTRLESNRKRCEVFIGHPTLVPRHARRSSHIIRQISSEIFVTGLLW